MKFKIQTWTILDGWVDADFLESEGKREATEYDTFADAMRELKKHLVEMEEADMDCDECDWRVVPSDWVEDPEDGE